MGPGGTRRRFRRSRYGALSAQSWHERLVSGARGSDLVRIVFEDDQPVTEVPITELAHGASAVIRRVEEGERVIVTRRGRATALIVSVETGIEVMLEGSERFALLRREAREELEAGTAEALARWRASRRS